jgi:hypothetical protein
MLERPKRFAASPLGGVKQKLVEWGLPALTSEQKAGIVGRLLHGASEGKFLTKGELPNAVEEQYGKILTYG